MTNQEAIYQQKYLKEMHNATPEVIEACNMAIRSLEAWEKIKDKVCYMSGEDEKGEYIISLDDVLTIIDSYFEDVEK